MKPGEGCCLLGLGEHSGASEGGAAGVDSCLMEEAPCDKGMGGWFQYVAIGVNLPERLPRPLHPRWLWNTGLWPPG